MTVTNLMKSILLTLLLTAGLSTQMQAGRAQENQPSVNQTGNQTLNAPKVVVSDGQLNSISIAIPKLIAASALEKEIAADLRRVIGNNFINSGLISVVNPATYIQRNIAVGAIPRFQDWRTVGAESLLIASISIERNKLFLRFRLWDAFTGQQLAASELSGDRYAWRRIAHLLSDAIYKRLTGEEGYFDTKIAYIAESGPAKARIKRLALMDQDGAAHEFLTDGEFLALTPRFSPSGEDIAYLNYMDNNPQVHLLNLQRRTEQIVGHFQGMTFAPRFSPSGKRLYFSFANNGNSEIYRAELKNGRLTRMTDHPAIDVSPSPSPDGKRLAFVSDRSGVPQVYLMQVARPHATVKRLTFSRGSYSTPAWSPRGDMIAFTRQRHGAFAIGVIRTDGTGERILSESYHDEGPSWSPNGRRIVFFRSSAFLQEKRDVQLFSVDITGYDLRRVPTFGAASDPAWSPLLK